MIDGYTEMFFFSPVLHPPIMVAQQCIFDILLFLMDRCDVVRRQISLMKVPA